MKSSDKLLMGAAGVVVLWVGYFFYTKESIKPKNEEEPDWGGDWTGEWGDTSPYDPSYHG